MRVLVACEYSGRVRRAFAASGHEVGARGFPMGLSRARMDHGPRADSRVSAYTRDFYYGC